MPIGKFADTFVVGDVDAALKKADLVLDETFMTQSTGHQPLETRSAMAYWQNGKLYMHASTQSTVQSIASVARWVGIPADQIVFISEYTGGGFGSKIPSSIFTAIPALLSKKANAPVMMRITREEEHFIGRARPGILARVKVGFRKDGRMTALDMYAVMDNGPYDAQGDANTAAAIASLAYQPETMRYNGLAVLTNTPPKVSQRSPGGMQANGIMEPVISKAARMLGLDQVDVRRINAPVGKAPFGAPLANGKQNYVTSSFVREALDKGRELFNWDEKKARYSGKRQGTKARGIGVAVSPFSAGSIGFDGLFIIKPDGRIAFQSGIGNHGTHSVFDVHRVAADMLDVPWEQCDVVFGNTSKNLPWTCVSAGSQTAHAMTRSAHAAATDAIQKLQEIAAKSLGGAPASYKVAGGRVSGAGGSLTLAQAAQKAIALGGKYDGHELPGDINAITKASADRAGRSGSDGRGEGQLSARRAITVHDRRLRARGSRHGNRYGEGARLRRDRRRRHGAEPPESQGPDLRRRHARAGPRAHAAMGIRPAVRKGAGETVPSQPAADDSRHPGKLRCRRRQHRGSGNADGRARGRRAARGRGLRRGHERDCRRGRRRHLQALAGHGRHHPDVARERRALGARFDQSTRLGSHARQPRVGARGGAPAPVR